MSVQVHPSAIIDEGAQIGDDSRVWHFVHVCSGARIGVGVSLGQNVFVGNKVLIGDRCKIQNNVSIYDNVTLEEGVFCGPSMVFTNVYNPRALIERKDEYRDTLIRRGRHTRRELHHHLRGNRRGLRLCRRGSRGKARHLRFRTSNRRARSPDQLDERVRRKARSAVDRVWRDPLPQERR